VKTEPAPAATTTESHPAAPSAPSAKAAVKTAADVNATRPQRPARAAASVPAPATTADNGDAAFRRGEAYLYGRGVAENCDEAVKNLKAASAKRSAKARSAFGTMYATGHCAPRDLPTSYAWFALALRVDPNNQILEKDLTAIWNQMTPPERQAATKGNQ
jgi:TPR repeat protein